MIAAYLDSEHNICIQIYQFSDDRDANTTPQKKKSIRMAELNFLPGRCRESDVERYMDLIKLGNVPESFEFRKAAMMLIETFSIVNEHEIRKYHDMITFYCKKCSEILETENPILKDTEEKLESLKEMLVYLVKSSDDNAFVCSTISKELNFLHICTRKLKDSFRKMDVNIVNLLMALLQNVAMFEGEIVRSIDLIEALKPYLDSNDNTIRLLSLTTLADIVNETEANILTNQIGVVDFLVSSISKAIGNPVRTWNGWSIIELLWVVRKIARYDQNKRTIVKHGVVPCLIKMAKTGDKQEQKEAIYAIWSLSFDKDNRVDMRNNIHNWNVVKVLEEMSRSNDKELKQLSRYAMWTLKEQASHRKHEQHKAYDDRHVMISYNWRQKDVVKQIYNYVHKCGIQVWMDDSDNESTVEDMARAVENADIVLICYSPQYSDNNFCRAEAEYAFLQLKTIVPLKIEQNYKPDGWILSIIGDKGMA